MPPEGAAGSADAAGGGTSGGGGATGGGLVDPDERPDRLTRLFLWLRDALSRRTRNVVGYVGRGTASNTAEDRRVQRDYHDRGRFVEQPPILWRAGATTFEASYDPLLESVLRAHESDRTELLLLGRVADTIEVLLLARTAGSELPIRALARIVEQTQPLVMLLPLPRLLRWLRPRLFPWRVVVCTTDVRFVEDGLRPLAHWLGVGVDVTQGGRLVRHGSCRSSGGLYGTVGGMLTDDRGRRLAMTCGHVVAPGCGSLVWPSADGDGRPAVQDPDVALLREANCFLDRVAPLDRVVACATAGELEQVVRRGEPVSHTARASSGTVVHAYREGIVRSPAVGLAVNPGKDGYPVSRFPGLIVEPRPWRSQLLRWPPWRRPFSRAGDSGGWVLARGRELWLGVIVGALKERGPSLALQSAPLLEYLEQALNTTPGGFECSTR